METVHEQVDLVGWYAESRGIGNLVVPLCRGPNVRRKDQLQGEHPEFVYAKTGWSIRWLKANAAKRIEAWRAGSDLPEDYRIVEEPVSCPNCLRVIRCRQRLYQARKKAAELWSERMVGASGADSVAPKGGS
jgi:hypothetical protein